MKPPVKFLSFVLGITSLLSLMLLIYPWSLSPQTSSFSLSLDLDNSAGDQAASSLDASPNQVISIQIFGKDIQNANDLSTLFEYDATQVVYEKFTVGNVFPDPLVEQDSITVLQHNVTSVVQIDIASLDESTTSNSSLIGTLRFRTTDAFSSTEIRLVRAGLDREGQFETVTTAISIALGITSPSLDFDGSGIVDFPDFLIFVSAFGSEEGQEKYETKYDLNSDGKIAFDDFLILIDNFGESVVAQKPPTPPTSPTPPGQGTPTNSPDLVVDSFSVSDSNPEAGAYFTLSATVRNQGTGTSPLLMRLSYYQSTDETISTSDTEVGWDLVSRLDPSETGDESDRVRAPSGGTYYYGACIEVVSGESDTGNNCSSAVTVTVSRPDLIVESPSVSDSSPGPGASFTLSATVRNQGEGQSAFTTLRYYQSTDETISTGDTEVGTDYVSRLAASESSEESARLSTPSSEGTYYYGACVEAVDGESDTGNNCSSAVAITVIGSDLAVESPAVDNNTLGPEQSFYLSATVHNQGGSRSASTTLHYYQSTDETISTNDTEVDTDYVTRLDASESSDESVRLTAPSSEGTYYYGACVESVPGESDTGNNCSSAVAITVIGSDLVVESPTVSEDILGPEEFFRLSTTVRNQGGSRSASTTLRYYLSTDETISTSDTEVDTDYVTRLDASESSDERAYLNAPLGEGTYYYGACVESVSGESDTGNNCSDAVRVTVTGSDLVVESPSVSENTLSSGQSFYLNATVRNQGGSQSAATTLRYYLSTDETINTSDTEVDTDYVTRLDASESSDASARLTAPSSEGTYYYGACVESVSGESDTGNNCSNAIAVTVARTISTNQPPTFSEGSSTTRSLHENTTGIQDIGNPVRATDSDQDRLTYSLEGTDAESFSIISTNGQLRTLSGVTYDYETKSSYSVRVRVDDSQGGSAIIAVRITLTDENEPPHRPNTPTVTASTLNSLSVRWTAPDNTGPAISDYDVRYKASGGNFTNWNHNGSSATTTITGLTANTRYEVQVRAINDEGTGDWSPSVNGTTTANQAPTFSEGSSTTRRLYENTTGMQNIGNPVTATDSEGDVLTYSLEGTDAGSFSIISTTGQLSTQSGVMYDYETKDSYLVTVRTQDGQGGSATIAVRITLTDENEPPHRPNTPTVTVPTLNSLTIRWTAPENTGPVISDYDVRYKASGGNFTNWPHTGTGTTTTIRNLTANTRYEVQLRAINDEGTGDWSPSVNGTTTANQAPTFSENLPTRSVAENTTGIQNIENPVTATDSDGGTLTYSLEGTDAGSFNIVSTTGQLKTQSGVMYDYETKDSYLVTVRVEDGQGGSATIEVEITLTDVNEPPGRPTLPLMTASTLNSLSVRWTAPDNTGPVITDYDVRYKAISGNFTNWPHTGKSLTTTIMGLTTGTTYEVQVRAVNDEGTGDWSPSVNGTTTDNQAPTFSGSSTTRSIAENATGTQNIGNPVTATDSDGGTLTYSLEGTDAGSFSIVSDSGQLKTQSGVIYDYEVKESYLVTVRVEDGQGGSATIEVEITLTDENEPPHRPAAPTVTASTSNSLSVHWTTPDNTGPVITDYDVRYKASGGNFTNWPHTGNGLTTTITGLTTGTTYEVQVRAINDEGTGDWSPSVNGTTTANQAPEFSENLPTRSVVENTTETQNIGNPVTATDSDGGTLTYSLEGTDAGSFSIVSDSGQLKTQSGVIYDYEVKDSYLVTVRVEDGQGGSATIEVEITLTDENEPPHRPAAPTVTASTSNSLSVHWTAPDNTGPVITDYDVRYKASGGNFTNWPHTGKSLSTTITGLITGTTYEVQVRAVNDEGTGDWSPSVNGTTTANQAPEFSENLPTRSVVENTTETQNIGNPVTATDSDGGTLTYSLEGTDAGNFSIVSDSGQLKTQPGVIYDYEVKDSYLVTVRVEDGQGGSATIEVEITLTDENEPPHRPAAPTVTASTSNSLSVRWTAPNNTGPVITDYDVRYKASGGNFTNWPHTGKSLTTTITGLTTDTTYEVQVRAINDEGTGDWSISGEGTTQRVSIPQPTINSVPMRQGEVARALITVGKARKWYSRAGTENIGSAIGDLLIFDNVNDLNIDRIWWYNEADFRLNRNPLNHSLGGQADFNGYFGPGGPGENKLVYLATPYGDLALDISVHRSIGAHYLNITPSASDVATLNQVRPNDRVNFVIADPIITTNKAPVFSDVGSTMRSIAENTAAGQDIGSPVIATDSDGGTLTYSLEGTDAGSFTIVSTSGQLQTAAGVTYDYETKDSYSVTVRADDGQGGSATIAVRITLTDENESPHRPNAPTVIASTSNSLSLTWTAPMNTGSDITDYDVRYKASGGNFMDWPHTGTSLSTAITNLPMGTTYEVQVRAVNDEGTGDWSPSVNGTTTANQAPTFSSSSTTRSIAENTAAGQDIGNSVIATDSDGGTLTYSLEGTDTESFSIVSTTGQLRTKTNVTYDYETKSSYSVTVRADDGQGGSATITVGITVTDVNEPPEALTTPIVTAISPTSLKVTWATPPNTGPEVTDYDVQYRTGSSGNFAEWSHTGIGTTTTITDLTTGTSYEVQVRAVNDEGTGDWSPSGNGTPRKVVTPVCDRSPQVRDAIVAKVSGVNTCSAVTEAHLAEIDSLSLNSKSIYTLKVGDFSGLSSLEYLNLQNTELTTLPAGIFSDLSSLKYLRLDRNQLTTLPAGVFSDLSSLKYLDLSINQLTTLPAGVFSGLSSLTAINLFFNQLRSLPAGVFSGLSSLIELSLSEQQLRSLPAGVFSGLSSLTSLDLSGNDLTRLEAGVFSGLSTLTTLYLSDNDLTRLEAGVFSGLSTLTTLYLSGNSVDPLPLTLSLELIEEGQFKATVPPGAPFNIVLPLTVTNGTIDGGASSITIPVGRAESEPLTVSRTQGTTRAVTVDIRTLPYRPSGHTGYSLVESATLPLTVISRLPGNATPSVCDRTGQVRDAIMNKLPHIENCSFVREENLATINSLSLRLGREDLTSGDFSGLTALDTLRLSYNDFTSLPKDIFDGLTKLTFLELGRNDQLSSLPDGIFDDLIKLTHLHLYDNRRLSSLPESIFDGLIKLTHLNLDGNSLTSLPSDLFSGLTALDTLRLYDNQLSSLPDGIFSGLTALKFLNLTYNTVDPLPITISLEKVEAREFKARAHTGAPFPITLPVSTTNGTIAGGTTTITIPTGRVDSAPLTVFRTSGTTGPITADIGTLPDLPHGHYRRGYELVKSTDLPLEVSAPAASQPGFAPADQNAFNTLVVGKVLSVETYYIEFGTAGRFEENNQYPGSYTYSNEGAKTVALTQYYDGGQYGGSCTTELTFTSTTAGTLRYKCGAKNYSSTEQWRLSDAPNPNAFDIEIVWVGPEPSATNKAAFDAAVAHWERVITDDIANIVIPSAYEVANIFKNYEGPEKIFGLTDDLRIYAHLTPIDGEGRILASAGPVLWRSSSNLPAVSQMRFDTDDLAYYTPVALQDVVLHEMAHALGFGTLWTKHGLLQNPSLDSSGQPIAGPPDTHFTGDEAVAAFNRTGGLSYTGEKVPVENEKGGQGTRDVHWRQSVFGPNELMEGFTDTEATIHVPMSEITIQSLADLGYIVNVGQADPYTLPSPAAAKLAILSKHLIPLNCIISRPIGVIDENKPINQKSARFKMHEDQ